MGEDVESGSEFFMPGSCTVQVILVGSLNNFACHDENANLFSNSPK